MGKTDKAALKRCIEEILDSFDENELTTKMTIAECCEHILQQYESLHPTKKRGNKGEEVKMPFVKDLSFMPWEADGGWYYVINLFVGFFLKYKVKPYVKLALCLENMGLIKDSSNAAIYRFFKMYAPNICAYEPFNTQKIESSWNESYYPMQRRLEDIERIRELIQRAMFIHDSVYGDLDCSFLSFMKDEVMYEWNLEDRIRKNIMVDEFYNTGID